MKHFVALLAIVALALALGGCNEKQELSKQDQETLKNNLTRELTPEESSKLGGGPAAGGDQGGGPAAAPPPEKGGG